MSLEKKERCWTEDSLARVRAVTVQQERDEVFAGLQYAASFHCLVEEWKDCEELKPRPEDKWVLVYKSVWQQTHIGA